jgi:hypothetical protein
LHVQQLEAAFFPLESHGRLEFGHHGTVMESGRCDWREIFLCLAQNLFEGGDMGVVTARALSGSNKPNPAMLKSQMAGGMGR